MQYFFELWNNLSEGCRRKSDNLWVFLCYLAAFCTIRYPLVATTIENLAINGIGLSAYILFHAVSLFVILLLILSRLNVAALMNNIVPVIRGHILAGMIIFTMIDIMVLVFVMAI